MPPQHTMKLHHVHRTTLVLSLVISLCLGFTSHHVPNRVKISFVRRSYKQDDIQPEPFEGFDDIRVNGTGAVPDDVPNDVRQTKLDETLEKEKTLYEILGADPTATRSELKKCYVKLAKITHPDAIIASGDVSPDQPDFGDIAAAWRVLGDAKLRKRYDRNLLAKEFSENVERFANERLEKAVPAVAEMMDKVAVPFLRRTTATTWAVGQAVAKGVSGFSQQTAAANNTNTFTDAVMNAVKAGQDAGRVIDSIELTEKSSELEQRAEAEQARAIELEQQLQNVTEQRLFATLNSPKLALSAEEAKQVLDKLDLAAEQSQDIKKPIKVGGILQTSVSKEIAQLEQVEQDFTSKLGQYEETDREWRDLLQMSEVAKTDLSERKEQEIEARKALVRAQQMVTEAKAHLVSTTNALKGVEQRVRRNAQEMDRVTSSLAKRQERVRVALRQRAGRMPSGLRFEYRTADDVDMLRQKEIRLSGETKQVSMMVARLQSRAEKLKVRAEALEKWQNSGGDDGAVLKGKTP